LRLVDKDIKLVSCGYTVRPSVARRDIELIEQGAGEWDREVLATLIAFVDLHSIHF
jgi:hypothetical protein